jgi:hypothetical protein
MPIEHESYRVRILSTRRVSPVAGFFIFFYTFFFPDHPIQGRDAPAEDALLPAYLLIEEGDQAQTQLPQG